LADAFPISGSIDPKAFPYLLMDLHRNGATGSLKVEGPSYQKALYFRTGRVLFGSSNDPRDQLGSILIETGKITPEQLEDVQSKVGPGNPLAKALADTGYVSQRELSDAARAKVESILSDVIAYTSGNFEFEDGVLPKGAIDLKLSTEKLVLASVRRLTDRNFVLRHLDGLDVVLAPGAELAAKLPELQPEAGGLPEQMDGKRTLKEAASLTRLDEFDAAKVACALLFLGLLQRAPAAAPADEVVGLADNPIFNAGGVGDEELDLGDTARHSIETTPVPVPLPIPEPEPLVIPEPAAPIAAAAASVPVEVAAETPFFIPDPEDAAPTVMMPPPAPAFGAEAGGGGFDAEAEPFHIEAPPSVDPAPATLMMPAPTAATVMMPSPLESLGMEAEPEIAPPPAPPRAAPSRPSKDDQAALDALLSAPAPPVSGAASSRRPSKVESWSAPPPRSARRVSTGPSPLVLGGATLALVALAAGAAWWLWGRTPAAAGTKAAAAGPPATAPGHPPAVTAPATVAPGPALTPRPPTATAAPPVTTASARPRTGAASLAESRALLQGGNLEQAAQGFAATVKAAPASAASVQILVACSPETVQKAMANASSPELFIVPVNYKGRDCYRLCWGLYETEARAASAVRTLPEYFRKGATPRVVAASEIVR